MRVADLLSCAVSEARAGDSSVAATLLSFAHKARIVEDPATPTLSIEPEGLRYRLRAGPDFCRDRLQDGRDALVVVAHELLHAFRGHFDLRPEHDPVRRDLQNLALDILVNAIVLANFVPRGAGLFARLYPADAFPGCLLLPPRDLLESRARRDPAAARLAGLDHAAIVEAWQPGSAQRPRLELAVEAHFTELERRCPGALARLYLDGWLLEQEPQGYWDRLRRLLEAELGRRIGLPPELILLGDHGDDGTPRVGGGPPGIGALRATPSRVPPSRVPPKEARRFFARVRQLADDDPSARTPGRRSVQERTVVPRSGRRELPALALGCPPPFYRWSREIDVDDNRGIHVYLDVSGSTSRVQALFLGLASTLGRSLAEPAWAWSAQGPLPITREELGEGLFRSYGGTDFDPVVAHALRKGFRRLLVMTDGEFEVGVAMEDRVRRAGLEITFLLDTFHRSPWSDRQRLERLGSQVIDVPRQLA